MLPQDASSLLVIAGVALAICLFLHTAIQRWSAAHQDAVDTARELKAEIDARMKSLYALVDQAGRTADRLEAALARSAEIPGGSLAAIESLGEPAALDDSQSLARVAGQVTTGADSDPFAANDRQLAIARLKDQGLGPADIARRLSLPIGEVELLLNLRST